MSKSKTPARVVAVLERRRSSASGSHTSRKPRGARKREAIREQEHT